MRKYEKEREGARRREKARSHVCHLLGRDGGEGRIERSDVGGGDGAEVRVAHVLVARVEPHGEVGAVDLQLEAGGDDRLVLGLHGGGEGAHVGLVVAVEVTILLHTGGSNIGFVTAEGMWEASSKEPSVWLVQDLSASM